MAAQEIAAADAAASDEVDPGSGGESQNATGASAGDGTPDSAGGASSAATSGSSQTGASGANVTPSAAGSERAVQGALAGLWAGGDGATDGVASADGVGRATAGGPSNAALPPGAAPALSPLLAQNLSAAGAAAAAVTRGVSVPVTDPDWPRALAAQVQWMAGTQLQSATLRLSPPHLGSLEVRIDLQPSQQINVTFSASHPDTRTALADAMPRLRELFAAGGLSLGQATVQQEAGSDASGSAGRASARRAATLAVAQSVEPVALAAPSGLGLVDEYV